MKTPVRISVRRPHGSESYYLLASQHARLPPGPLRDAATALRREWANSLISYGESLREFIAEVDARYPWE